MPLVKIPGMGVVRFPDEMSHDQIVSAIENDVIPQYKASIEPAKGLMEPLKGGIKQSIISDIAGITGIGDATEAAKTGLARQQAVTEREAFSPEKIKYLHETEGLLPAVAETIKQIPGTIEEQFPNLAKAWVGGRAGAMLPVPPQLKPFTALGGAAAALYPSTSGQHIMRQAQEQQAAGKPINVNAGAAYSEAAPSALLDAIADRFAFGRLLGLKPSQIGTAAAEKIAERGLTRTLAGGVGKTIASEVPTEVLQQMMERHQAGLDLASSDAIDEYRRTAYQTAMMGPLGMGESISERAAAKQTVEQDKQQREAQLREIAAERQRRQNMVYAADQELADTQGADAVREEINRQQAETRQQMTDTLRNLLDQKAGQEAAGLTPAPEAPKLNLSTKEGIKEALTAANFDLHFPEDQYSKEDRNVIRNDLKTLMKSVPTQAQAIRSQDEAALTKTFGRVFGEHTLTELGIPKNKKNIEITEPFYGKVLGAGEVQHGLINALDEIKMSNKGPKDDEINAKIDNYIDKHLTFEKNQKALAETPVDESWREAMQRGRVYTHGTEISPEGYRFTEGKEFQPDLFHPGESMNVYTAPKQGVENVQPITNDARQLGLEFGPESDRSGLAATDVGGGTESRYDRAEPVTVGPTGEPVTTDNVRERPDYSSLALRGKGWAQTQRAITGILEDKNLSKSEDQAEALNTIADAFTRFGMDPQTAMNTAIEIRNQYAQWPTPVAPKKTKKQKAAAQKVEETPEALREVPTLEPEFEGDEGDILAAKRKKRYARPAKSVEDEDNLLPASAKEVETELRKVIPENAWNKNPPTIVENYSELPESFREIAEAGDMKAFTDPRTGKDYYIADQMKSGKVLGSVMHERGGHIGLVNLIGKDRINALANRIYKWDSKEGKTKADKLGQEIAREAINRALESGEEIGSNRFNQEVIAYFTEVAVDDYKIDPFKKQPAEKASVAGWLRELWNGILATIKKLHYNPDAITAHDIVELVHGAARIETKSTEEAAVQASKAPDEKAKNTQKTQVDYSSSGNGYFKARNPFNWEKSGNRTELVFELGDWKYEFTDNNDVMVAPRNEHMDSPIKIGETHYTIRNGGDKRTLYEGSTGPDKANIWPSFIPKELIPHLNAWTKAKGKTEAEQDKIGHDIWTAFHKVGEKEGQKFAARREEEQPQASRKAKLEPTDAEKQAAINAGRTFFTDKEDYTFAEKAKAETGGNFWGWLGNKLVGGGTSFELKGTDFFGPDARLNPETGKELGFLNYHRSLHDTDLATGAAANGYLDIDNEGVIHVVESNDNVRNLNTLADTTKKAMMADGMSEAAANDAFTHMTIADRAKELQHQGVIGKDEFTDADYAYGKQLQAKYGQEYKEWQNMYQRIRARTIALLVKTGVFTPEKAKTFLDRFEYIPFHREQDPNVSDGTFLRSLLSAKREYHIKGSTRQIKNVMENILDNQVWLMKRAVRNNASNLIADTMHTMHKSNPLMGGYPTNINDKSPNTVEYLKNGEIQRFKIIDKNDAAIFAAAPAVANTAIRFMRAFTGVLRKGVTLMPSFMYNQIIQDAMRAPVVAGTQAGMFQLLKKSAPEFMKNIKSETELARALRDAGIVGQIDYQDTYDNFKKELFGAERKGIAKYLELGERMAQANDLATRAAVYDNVLKNGGSKNEASLRALMMINFQNRGHSQFMNYLMALAPFVNSRIQGEFRLLQALRGRIPGVSKAQAKQVIAWRLAKMAAFTAIYAMAASGDDDYERAGEEVKNHNFLINGFKIPVAPEFLPYKVAIEKAYRLASDQPNETASKSFRAEMSALAGLAFGVGDVTPTAVKPLMENLTNYSTFTNRPLVSYSLSQADTNQQYNEGTSEVAKWISNLMFNAGETAGIGGNLTSVSPIKLDNLMRGWMGSMGRDFLYTTDMLSGNKPAAKINQMPILGAMFYDQEGGALKSDFYELKDRVDRANNTLSKLRQQDPEKARDYLEANRPLIAMHSSINAINNQLNNIRKQKARALANDPDSARDKFTELDNRAYEMLKDRMPRLLNRLDELKAEQ